VEENKTMQTLTNFVHTIQAWHAAGKDAALAVLVRSSGATPLPLGEMMVISSALDMQGAVSRGCVESAVLEIASTVIRNDLAQLCHFGYSDQNAFDVGLTCGGEIDVLVSALPSTPSTRQFLEALLSLSQRAQPFYLMHILEEQELGKKILCDQNTISYSDLSLECNLDLRQVEILNDLKTPTIQALPFSAGKTLSVFIQPIQPPQRLFIIGAGQIAIYLTPMAKLLGFSVIIIDPRSMFATPTRFPDANIVLPKWPQDCVELRDLHTQDALAVISHDQKIDIPALQLGLKSDVSYLGLLGSTKTRQDRFSALLEAGWKEQDLARIHAPIGLDLHTRKADEIALAIMAQIIQLKNQA